jgi:diguanylate cyclase (GGDEF)-like protein
VSYQARRHWASLVGVLSGVLVVILGWVIAAPLAPAVTLAAVVIALGFGMQLLVEKREGIVRERRLVTTAADLRAATAALERLATIDPLTGVLNRRAFFEALGTEFRRSQRYGHELSVVMIDIDDFKAVNDQGGHLFGDYVLATTARVLSEQTRESDVVARYGGEEFVVMLPETDEQGCAVVAEKLLRAIEGLEYRSPEFPPPRMPAYRITISAGLACGPVEPAQGETELVRRADRALYAAKFAGKNRVHRWTPTGSLEVAQTSA